MIKDSTVNHGQISKIIKNTCDQGADVIVLGCTHCYWIKKYITSICKDRATVIEPSISVCHRVKDLLKSC